MIDSHVKEHEMFTDKVLTEQKDHGKYALDKATIDKHVKTLNKSARAHLEGIEHRDKILEVAKDVQQFEVFLETAPQTILQLYIIFIQSGEITATQWITLTKCFIFFLTGAMTNYLGPTKVNLDFCC